MRIELNEAIAGTEQARYQDLARWIRSDSPQYAVFVELYRALKHVLFYDIGSSGDMNVSRQSRINECAQIIRTGSTVRQENAFAGALMAGEFSWLERAAPPAAVFCGYVSSAIWAGPNLQWQPRFRSLAEHVQAFIATVSAQKSEMRRWYLAYLVLPVTGMSMFTEMTEENEPAGQVIQVARDMITKEIRMYDHMQSLAECRTTGEGVFL